MEYLDDLEEGYTGNVNQIDIKSTKPTQKDFDRVENLKSTQVEKMANSIKDPIKLVGRAKAYIVKHGDGLNAFTKRMKEMGFTDQQIADVTNYHPRLEKIGSFADFINL